MDETAKMESHLSSAAAFVEGGIQDACDDACSICLEAFCESDPSTVTCCKHEFHLQCILEWCQRSSQCPMCWQTISLKDPTSQELLEAVEKERSFRTNQSRNATIFHHPALGDIELQHLQVGANDAELEERIIQHLAAAAAMGRAHHLTRREGHRSRSTAQGRPQFLLFSTHPNSHIGSVSASSGQRGENEPPVSAVTVASPSDPLTAMGEETPHEDPHITHQADPISVLPSGNSVNAANRPGLSNSRSSAGQSTPGGQDRAGLSDFQSFSESLKSRLNAVSVRYKESITKSTRGWREQLFSRNTAVADLSSEVRREVNAGIATVSHMMEHLDTRENDRAAACVPHRIEGHSAMEQPNALSNDSNAPASCAATSGPN